MSRKSITIDHPRILDNVKQKLYSEFYQRTLDDITIYEHESSDLVDLSLLAGVCSNFFSWDHERLYSKVEEINNELGLRINYVRYCDHEKPTCNARQMLEIQGVTKARISKVIWGFQSIMLQFHFKIPSEHKFPIRCEQHASTLAEHNFRLTRIDLSRGFAIFQQPQIEVELKFKGDWAIYTHYQIEEWKKLIGLAKSSELMLLQPRLRSTDDVYIMTRLVWNAEKISPKEADEKFTEVIAKSGFAVGEKIFPIFFLSHPKLRTLEDFAQKHREDVKDVGFDAILLKNTIDLAKDISKAREISEALKTLLT